MNPNFLGAYEVCDLPEHGPESWYPSFLRPPHWIEARNPTKKNGIGWLLRAVLRGNHFYKFLKVREIAYRRMKQNLWKSC